MLYVTMVQKSSKSPFFSIFKDFLCIDTLRDIYSNKLPVPKYYAWK